ncbi:Kazal domain-containing protein [Metarhizium album ARSEF 1941]|uniref:Kazal domain-containing protein n=1 Tax=Metarhizium album (strain ARSEF 1941) TaxID=1081103 RepID=A0A0B2WWS3_METAS|nr:Kazal domain-containing protein [Metarhizium album ARSEF 1941]KHN97300.1 Kazal domain-containing protein [Metarhizium album ARSEF 1941]
MLSKYVVAVAALGLSTLASAQRPCGLRIAPCPADQRCVPNSPRCTDLNRCRGTCQFRNKYTSCGGFVVHPATCPDGFECRDDPRLPGSCGLACDKPGVCIPKSAPPCGGFAGFACPTGLFCYDVPGDGCDPKNGGADCIGVCL